MSSFVVSPFHNEFIKARTEEYMNSPIFRASGGYANYEDFEFMYSMDGAPFDRLKKDSLC